MAAPMRRLFCRVLASSTLLPVVALISFPAIAGAQTTVTLSAPGSQLTDDVTIRGGGYAAVNMSTDDTLATKTSADVSNVRRVLMKFDTANNIPAGATVSKATLTLTLRSAGAASSRPLAVHRVTKSFLKGSASWLDYRSGADWGQAGGDLAEKWATVNVGRSAGTTVTFDVTSFVQQTVKGGFGTRYTRFALVDVGAPDNESLRVFHSSRAANASVRPKLVVTYGGSTTTTSSTSSGTSSGTLKVMTYNTHHGVGTDGRYDLNRIATVIANERPDVVSLNEVMYNSSYGNGENQPETYRRMLEQKTGQRWYSVYARMDGNWGSTNWSVGNQLLSRYPFVTTTRYSVSSKHSVAHGTIMVNNRTVNVFSTHLEYYDSSLRTAETKQLRSWASSWAENRVIMGDFNARPGTTDHQIMTSAYSDTWADGVKAGIASSPSGSYGYTHGGSRFDYIYRSLGASSLALTKVVVLNTSVNGAKPSDHDPVVATFSVK